MSVQGISRGEEEGRRTGSAGSTLQSGPAYRGSLTWPILLIAVGVMFLLEEFVPHWSLHKTWPVLLIVVGVLKLLDLNRPTRPPEGPRIG